MQNKVGLHFVLGRRTGVGEFFRRIKEANKTIPIVKGLDEFSLCKEAKEIFGDKVLTIGRLNSVNGVDLQGFDFAVKDPNNIISPQDLAYWIFGLVEPVWRLHPYVDAWEVTNEWSEYWSYQTDLMIELMKLADQREFRLGLYGFSTGNPPEYTYPEILRACEYASSSTGKKHFLSVHEYGGVGIPISTLKGTEPNFALRYRLLYNFIFSQNPFVDTPCVITEAGQNAGYEFIGVEEFINDFAWYNARMNEDSYILGCAAWTLGNWYNANFQDALPSLADYIIAIPEEPKPYPIPIPPTEINPVILINPTIYHPTILNNALTAQFPGVLPLIANVNDLASINQALNILYPNRATK